MNILQWAVDASDGAINALVYAVIVLLFVWGFFRCIVPIARTRGTLKRAIRLIKKGASGKRSWQEDKFLGKGRLFPHWSEYLNNLFFADGVYHNASNVEDYINEDTVIYGPGRMSFAEAIPGLMVSLGFLGTLMGLTEGLTGFSMSDAEAVQHSIVTLIPGMRYAFMTSIWGVVGSISFTLITRFISGSTQHTLQDFYGAMSVRGRSLGRSDDADRDLPAGADVLIQTTRRRSAAASRRNSRRRLRAPSRRSRRASRTSWPSTRSSRCA